MPPKNTKSKPQTRKVKKTRRSKSQKNRLLERLYYESNRPSALGGVEKLYRAAKKHGITRSEVIAWLRLQPGYTLHNPARRRFRRNKVFVNGIDDQWQADLVDLQSLSRWNRGHKYLLTCIDILSKYAWVVPLKTKTGSELVKAFTKIFQQSRKPDKLQTDAGTEFKNKTFPTFLKQHHVQHFVTYNEAKAQVVERFNRTLKQMMWRLFTTGSSYNYLDKINDTVSGNYNQTFHRSIKMKPSEVTAMNSQKVWRFIYGKQSSSVNYKFKVGDQVKISKHNHVFEKSYLPNWSEETFTVAQRIARDPSVYKLKELDGELIKGPFYETELQKVIEPKDHLFRVEKVLRRRSKGGQAEVLVHWKGWPKKYDSWIPARQLVSLK